MCASRWYRAPECLLTDGYYNYKMDMWGVGCVFFEIVSLFPLFPGTNELDQIQKIHSILGTPAPELLAKMKKRSAHMDFNFPPKASHTHARGPWGRGVRGPWPVARVRATAWQPPAAMAFGAVCDSARHRFRPWDKGRGDEQQQAVQSC